MIIPREHGGLGFGHFAHAAVVTRIATVNVAAAVTVMVPNSLGPAELLLHYGTEAQKHALPAAPGRRPRTAVFRPDLAVCRLGRGVDPRSSAC